MTHRVRVLHLHQVLLRLLSDGICGTGSERKGNGSRV